MIDLENNTSCTVNLSRLEEIASALTSKDVELIVVSNEEIKELNSAHRNIDKATDVLSFPLDGEFEDMPLGSIVISVDFVEEKSKEHKHSFEEEFSLLFIHGLLHLLGYDHEVDDGEHRQKEEEIINKFELPQSLIVRNS